MSGSIDRSLFYYSLRRHDIVEVWELGKDTDLTMSAIRAATESRKRLPMAMFQGSRERLLIDFLCGDPVDHFVLRTLRRDATEVWLYRSGAEGHLRIPVCGLTLRAFEALLYSAKFQIERPQSIVRERLDGALLYCMGFSMLAIESDGKFIGWLAE